MDQLITVIGLCLIVMGCQQRTQESFKSEWNKSEITRNWAGKDYWLNPLQSWKQEDGVLKCGVSGGDRNAVLLTRSISEMPGSFTMVVIADPEMNADTLGESSASPIDNKLPNGLHTHGWVGFQVGLKGQFNDYRDDAIKGIGLCAGITSNGYLKSALTSQANLEYMSSDFICTHYI